MPKLEEIEVVDVENQTEEETQESEEIEPQNGETEEEAVAKPKGRRKSVDGKPKKGAKPKKGEKKYPEQYYERTKLTAEKVEELFGVRYLDKDETGDHLFKLGDVRVVFDNNKSNRMFDEPVAWKYAQDILTKNWQCNMEPIIFSEEGDSSSGQKRGAAVLMARWLYQHPKFGEHWKKIWGDEEPWMDTYIAYGCSSAPEVLRTHDNVQTRSFADTLYAVGKVFADKSPEERGECCKILDSAIKTLWLRTWAVRDQYTAYKTQSECADFVERHPRLVEAVSEIWEAYGKGQSPRYTTCRSYLPAGPAAALLYLMAASSPKNARYHDPDTVHDKKEQTRGKATTDWSRWDKACEFWGLLCDDNEEMTFLVKELADLINDKASPLAKTAAIIHAWNLYVEGEVIKRKDVKVKFKNLGAKNGKEIVRLDDFPVVGGIDLGPDPPANEETKVSEEDKQKAKDELEAENEKKRESEVKERKKKERQARKQGRKGEFVAETDEESDEDE